MRKRVLLKSEARAEFDRQVQELQDRVNALVRNSLTPREAEVLKWVKHLQRVQRSPVRQRDVAEHFKIKRQRASQLWGRLVDKGYLKPKERAK